MYCIFARESLAKMNGNRGKMAAQAGHAYLHAYWDSLEAGDREATHAKRRTAAARNYKNSQAAVKVCLVVDTVEQLEALQQAYADVCGTSLVKDAARTVFAEPTVTCLGLGPIGPDDIGEDLKALPVLV